MSDFWNFWSWVKIDPDRPLLAASREMTTLDIWSWIGIAIIVGFALRGVAKEHPFEKGELRRCCIQLGVALLFAAPVWFAMEPSGNRFGQTIGSLAGGFGVSWLATMLYARIRYGKGTKINMD